MKFAKAAVLFIPTAFAFAPQQTAFRPKSALFSTETSTEKKVGSFETSLLSGVEDTLLGIIAFTNPLKHFTH